MARPLDVLSAISRPALALPGASTDAVVLLFGGKPQSEAAEICAEELRDLVTTTGA